MRAIKWGVILVSCKVQEGINNTKFLILIKKTITCWFSQQIMVFVKVSKAI